jgi:uncharacterized protein involved in outer membrane biogenesis
MSIERGGAKRRGLRAALVAVTVLVAAFAVAAAVFVAGLEVSGEFLRAPLERALSAAFRVPARIEGPLRLRTGLGATVSADALVLADPSGPDGATIARGLRPSARIDLVALLRRAVALDEVTGERLELTLVRHADGRANWAPMFAASPAGGKSSLSFDGIARLRVGTVTGRYEREGAAPVPFAISALDGALPRRDPVAARGGVQVAGQAVAFDLRSASLAELAAPRVAIPVQGTVTWSGTRAEVDGELARDGSRFDADLLASADDATAPLAALGIAADQPGRLELRMRIDVSATEASARDLTLAVGNSVASGSASVAWAGPRWRIAADLAGERIDVEPFAFARSRPQDKTTAEALVELLERAAADADAEVRLVAGELVGLPVAAHELKFEGHSRARVVGVRGGAVVSGTRVEVRLDYDARQRQRILAAQIEGGGASTAGLSGKALPHDVSGSVASIRGLLRAQGEDARSLVASAEANLEARDLRWSIDRRSGAPFGGRFDLMRVVVQGTRASSAEVSGKLGDAACSVKVSGGALAPLLEGEPWPLRIAASCPGERFSAKGNLALAQRHVVGELAFDAAADRLGPVARVLGVATALPHPIAARGRLVLDEKLARAQFAALRLGRTAGSGEVAIPIGAAATPRLQLALATLDLDELVALAGPGPSTTGRSGHEGRGQDLRLDDLDFDIAAERASLAEEKLRRLKLAGAVRSRKLPPAPFRFEWERTSVSGSVAADFGGAAPRIELDAAANDADLRALLARFGYAEVGLRAGVLSLKARAEGAKLGELLASATLSTTVERGQLDLLRGPVPGLSGRSEFAATLTAAPGQPTTLAARGAIDGQPLDLSVETSSLADFVRAGAAIPVTGRITLGDARLDVTGKVARDGAGEGRLQLSGSRLDRLGVLLGMPLPEASPYSASASVVASADVIRASGLALSLGRSRVAGDLRIERRGSGRPRYLAELRVPVLHLEDVGADQWLRSSGRSASGAAAGAPNRRRAEVGIDGGLDFLRAADIDATVDIDELHGAGERYASGRVRMTGEAGVLRVRLQEVRAAGGALDADILVDASTRPATLGLRAQVQDVEYGPLARAMNPGSTAAGKLDLIADLAAQAPPDRLLPALSGTLDAAIYPRGLHSGGLAFWGAGLLDAMLGQLDPQSRSAIECAVTSLDFGGGMARSTALFVDTARVRIVGQFEADLTTRALSGRIDPLSKEPRFLTFAPTMRLGGTLDSPRLSVAPENVLNVPLRMAAPLSGFALNWLKGSGGQAREGASGCREAFEQIRQARSGGAEPAPR